MELKKNEHCHRKFAFISFIQNNTISAQFKVNSIELIAF